MTKRYLTETVPTNTLKVGDTILAHGGLFRVIEVKVAAERADDMVEVRGHCHVNLCEFIDNAYEGSECQIPVQWRDGSPDLGNPGRFNFWNQQGNGLARTVRVIGVDHCG